MSLLVMDTPAPEPAVGSYEEELGTHNLIPYPATGATDVAGGLVELFEDSTEALLGAAYANPFPETSGPHAGLYAWSILVTSWTGIAGAVARPATSTQASEAAAGSPGVVVQPSTAASAGASAGANPGAAARAMTEALSSALAVAQSAIAIGTAVGSVVNLTACVGAPGAAPSAKASVVATEAATGTTIEGDTTAPTVTAFTVGTPTGSSVPIASFTATDAVGVTGYLVTESSTPPASGAAGWAGSAPSTYTAVGTGSVTLYPWAKDAAGNVSSVFGSPRTVTIASGATPADYLCPALDAHWCASFDEAYASGVFDTLAVQNDGDANWVAGIIFAVASDPGSVTSALLRLVANVYASGNGGTKIRIYGKKTTSAAVWADGNAPHDDMGGLTTAYVDWTIGAITNGVAYTSPNLVSIWNELKGQVGWTWGTSKVALILSPNLSLGVSQLHQFSAATAVVASGDRPKLSVS